MSSVPLWDCHSDTVIHRAQSSESFFLHTAVYLNCFVSFQRLPLPWVLSWCVFLFTSMDCPAKTPQKSSPQRLKVQKRDLLLCNGLENGQARKKKRGLQKHTNWIFSISLKLFSKWFKGDRLKAEVLSFWHVKLVPRLRYCWELHGGLIEGILHSCWTMKSSICKESRMKELNAQLYIMYIMEENWFLQCIWWTFFTLWGKKCPKASKKKTKKKPLLKRAITASIFS